MKTILDPFEVVIGIAFVAFVETVFALCDLIDWFERRRSCK